MLIKDMFQKPIDREIQGVIIVGQDENANVQQELEEYVVTKELQKHFADFFAAYKKGIVGTTPKMGVWISGFFGSGKSHFLKILSYLLENREVGGKRALDYICIDLKSFYASVECQERGLDPLTTNLVVTDVSWTEKTICLAVSLFPKAYGIPSRAQLFEVAQQVKSVNAQRKYNNSPG